MARLEANLGPIFTNPTNGSTVDVHVGEDFAVDLEETPTTGYRWHVDIAPGVTIMSSTLVPHVGAAIGGGGLRRIVLNVKDAGEFRFRAKLWREWVGDGSIVERRDVAIRAI